MKALIVAIGALVALSGCGQMSVSNFQKSEHSGVKENKLAFVLIEPDVKNAELEALTPVLAGDAGLEKALAETCRVPPEFKISAVPVAGLVATLGKLIFDLFMDNQIRQLEGLKKAAQGSYSERRLISSADLRKQRCALAVRYSKEGDKPYGLAALVRLVRQSDDRSFVMEPIYVRARNAVVVTEKPSEANKAAAIGIAIGLSIKAVARQKTNVPALQAVGEGVVSVPKLELGPNPTAVACDPKVRCPTSDLIPYPEPGKEVVSVTLSVAEVGKISVDFDQSIAELKAIKEALGPVLKDTIKEALKD